MTPQPTMIPALTTDEVLDRVYRHRLLVSREQVLGIPLDLHEVQHRLELASELRPVEARGERVFPRLQASIPVQFTRPGGFHTAELCDLGAGGLGMRTRRPPAIGTEVIVRIVRPWTMHGRRTTVEYVLPAEVVWTGDNRMGLRMSGVPSRSSLLVPVEQNLKSPLRSQLHS